MSAIETGCVTVRRKVVCLDLTKEADRITGVRTDHGVVKGSLIIIATGARSALRDKYFQIHSNYRYRTEFLNVHCSLIDQFASAAYYVLGPQGVMIMVPLPHGEMRIGLQFDVRGNSQLKTPEELAGIIRSRLATFPTSQFRMLGSTTYHLSRILCSPFWIPGAVLIGDAAHTTHPAGGQGMNLAFQDAECLAEQLGKAGLAPSAVDKACALYMSNRWGQVRRVLARTHFLGLMGAVSHPLYTSVRECALKLADRSSVLKRWVFRRIADVC